MAIEVRCPSGHRLSVEERHAGKRIRCPKCRKAVVVPTLEEESALQSEARPAPPPLPPRRKSVESVDPATDEETSEPSSVEAPLPPAEILTGPKPLLGYRVDPYHAQTAYAIAVGLALVAIFQLVPAIKRAEFFTAPAWVQCAILLAVVQLGYAAWMALAPDWSTLWVAMLAFAGAATLYGAALAIAVMTPRDSSLFLDMDDVRDSARLWCSAVILVTTLMTYVCGRASYKWYKSYQRTH